VTASTFARSLNARRIGKGKWMAKCPSHPDSRPSLAISEGRKGVVIRCMSHGCETADILKAVGLTFSDLFRDSITPEVRARTTLQEQRENAERRLGLVLWLSALDPDWIPIQKRIRGELLAIRCRMEPLEVYREIRGRQWKHMNLAQREKAIEGAYGLYQARGCSTNG